jgi:hypothetical protein
METEEIPTYEMELNPFDAMSGVYCISLVDIPAIKVNWIALSEKQKVSKTIHLQDDKQILISPVLIPGQKIIRKDDEHGLHNITFTPESIEQTQHKFMQANLLGQTSLMHERALVGNSVVESWIVADSEKDKSAVYGFDVPIGTWMLAMKMNDTKLWNEQIKTGKVKGFSIDGKYNHVEMSNETKLTKAIQLGLMPDTQYNRKDGGYLQFDGTLKVTGKDGAGNVLEPYADGYYETIENYCVSVKNGLLDQMRIMWVDEPMYLSSQEQAIALSKAKEVQLEWSDDYRRKKEMELAKTNPKPQKKYKTEKMDLETMYQKLVSLITGKTKGKPVSMMAVTITDTLGKDYIVEVDDATLESPAVDANGVTGKIVFIPDTAAKPSEETTMPADTTGLAKSDPPTETQLAAMVKLSESLEAQIQLKDSQIAILKEQMKNSKVGAANIKTPPIDATPSLNNDGKNVSLSQQQIFEEFVKRVYPNS